MTVTGNDVRDELLQLVARSEVVLFTLPRSRRPGVLGWVRRRLPAKRRVVRVKPATFQDWMDLDEALAGREAVSKWEWRRIRAWLALRGTYALSYDEFAERFSDAESVARLAPVVEAWDRVNASFRAGIERPVARSARAPGLVPDEHSTVGGPLADAGPA